MIDPVSLPADVRTGSAQDKALYETSLQFEQMLTEQLTQELDPSNDASGDGSDGDDDGTVSGYGQLLPGALAQSISDGGGLGLANELFLSLKQQQGPQ